MVVRNLDSEMLRTIEDVSKKLKRGESVEITCPSCNKGVMIVSKSGYNEHVWGICQECNAS
jgi:hypothetical protein